MKPFYSKERKFSDGSQVYDAATVILLRERDHAPFEFFLMRRHRKQNFMASAFVFPGGRLDEADCDPDLTNYAHGLSVEEASLKLNEPDLSKWPLKHLAEMLILAMGKPKPALTHTG